MSHVLEHSLRPLDWLAHAAKLLSPDGILAIAIPNFGGIYRFLGERDPWIIPPVHLQFFTPRSLRRALESSGLRSGEDGVAIVRDARSGRSQAVNEKQGDPPRVEHVCAGA